jgi:hypothetical protein
VLALETEPAWTHATIGVALVPTIDDAPTYVSVAAELAAPAGSTVAPADVLAALERMRREWAPALVVWSKSAAVAAHLEAWAADADVPTLALGPAEIRNASELFRAELVGRRLEHGPDPLLATQARRAKRQARSKRARGTSVRDPRADRRAACPPRPGIVAPEAMPGQPEIF